MWKDPLAHHFDSPTSESWPYLSQMLQTPDQAWTKRRCSLSSKFEQALAILHAVSDFFELKIISDISPFQRYRSIIAMPVSLAITIRGLSVLGEERLIAAETTVGSASPSHRITTWPSFFKYLEISVIIVTLLFSLERNFSWVEWNILISLITTSWHLIGDLLLCAFVFVDKGLF